MKKWRKLMSVLLSAVMAAMLCPQSLALELPGAGDAPGGGDARLMNIVPSGTAFTGGTVTGDGTAVQINGNGGTLTLSDGAPAGSTAYVYGRFSSIAADKPAISIGSGWTVYIGNTDSVATSVSAVRVIGGRMYGVKVSGSSTVTIDSGTINANSINIGSPGYDDIAYGVYAENGATVNIGASPAVSPSAEYTAGPQISTNGTSGNYGVTAVNGSTANLYQGYVKSQGVNASAVYIDGSTVNALSNDLMGTGRKSPAFLAEVGNLASDVAMSVTTTSGSAAWFVSGSGLMFSGYTALSANVPSGIAGGGLNGGVFRGMGYAVSLSYGPVQNELPRNRYLRDDASGDYYSYSNGTRAVSASGYAVSGTLTVTDGEKELINSMAGGAADYTMPCAVTLSGGGIAVSGARTLNMNGKNLEYDGTATDYAVSVPSGQSLSIVDRSAWQYTNTGTSSGVTPAGIIRVYDTGSAVKVEQGGSLTLGAKGAFGPMITAKYSGSETDATVVGLLSKGSVTMYSGGVYGTYAGAETDGGAFSIAAGSGAAEYSVISGKTHYGICQYGGTLGIAGGIISLDAASRQVNDKSAAYPWALYVKYGSNRDTSTAGSTSITGGYFYSVATDATVSGRNQQLADLMASSLSFADNQGVNLSTGAVSKPANYKIAAPYAMRGSNNAAAKGDYDNYLYYGYAIYNGMSDAASYEYNTGTGLHAVNSRAFASYFTVAGNKDYSGAAATNEKVCTCCGKTYTGASCPNCTSSRCPVCGKCPNHCTCKNTDLVTTDHFAYISGYPDGSFRPSGTLTRAEAAAIFYKLLQNKNYVSSKYFSDVNHSDWYYTAVSCLASKGIVSGYTDGCYHPGWKVTRAEFCVMAAKFYSVRSGTVHFTDVPDTYWGYKYIASAVAYGWISDGYGRYYPDDPMPRQEVVTFVNKMSGRIPDQYFIDSNYGNLKSFKDVPKGSANYYAVMEAANGHTYVQKNGVETWKTLSD